MESTKLVERLFTNCLNVEQPIESVNKKRAKQLQRRKTADPKNGSEGINQIHSSLGPLYRPGFYARRVTGVK